MKKNNLAPKKTIVKKSSKTKLKTKTILESSSIEPKKQVKAKAKVKSKTESKGNHKASLNLESKTWPNNKMELKNFIIGSAISFLALIALIFLLSFFCRSLFSLIKNLNQNYYNNASFSEDNNSNDIDKVERLSNLIYFGKEEVDQNLDEDKKDKDLDKASLKLDDDYADELEDYDYETILAPEFNIDEIEFMRVEEGSSFANLNFLNSPDGNKFAYIVKKDGKEAVSLNGDLSPYYDSITFMIFSPDSHRFAYGARIGSEEMVVLDGMPGKVYEWVFLPRFFTPDSRYFVYKTRNSEGDFLIFNETEGKIYEQIYQPFVNNDESALIFYSRNGRDIYKNVLKLK